MSGSPRWWLGKDSLHVFAEVVLPFAVVCQSELPPPVCLLLLQGSECSPVKVGCSLRQGLFPRAVLAHSLSADLLPCWFRGLPRRGEVGLLPLFDWLTPPRDSDGLGEAMVRVLFLEYTSAPRLGGRVAAPRSPRNACCAPSFVQGKGGRNPVMACLCRLW